MPHVPGHLEPSDTGLFPIFKFLEGGRENAFGTTREEILKKFGGQDFDDFIQFRKDQATPPPSTPIDLTPPGNRITFPTDPFRQPGGDVQGFGVDDIAKRQFDLASGPLEESFQRQRKIRSEELSAQGIKFGGLGNESRDRLTKVQDETLGRLSEQIAIQTGQQDFQQRLQQDQQQFQQGLLNQQQVISLARSGNLDTTIAGQQLASALGVTSIGDFLTDDQAKIKAFADERGLSVEEVRQLQNLLGETLAQDIRRNPDRYAGLAIDPAELRKLGQGPVDKANPLGDLLSLGGSLGKLFGFF